ncbi:hypothetical protein GOBAR_DD05683 [Gossypium barbadense]|nr:hypothetical protein GOBAR_DD05683 [Gossypium barbadense]
MDYQTALDIGNAIGKLMAIDWKDRAKGEYSGVEPRQRHMVKWIEGCLAVNAIGKSGGLFMMWKEGTKVEIKNYSNNHIDSLIHLENDKVICFTRFYGNVDSNKRQSSWDMLRKIGKSVKEKWIIEGDFNAILNYMEKDKGMRKQKTLIDDFQVIVDELSFDLEMDKGWFTWVNNREGDALVKERLDRFLISSNDVACFPFMETKVIRQSTFDHDVIFLHTGSKAEREDKRS